MPKPPRQVTLGERNPGRVAFAVDSLRRFPPTRTCQRLKKRFDISDATAWRDIAEARKLLAATAEKERPQIRAMETLRLERIAKEAERIAKLAEESGELIAASAAHKSAIAASKEIARMNGAYAPDKVEVTHGASPELAMQLDSILAILDEQGQAAFRVVREQIERAKTEGRLALPAPDTEIEDAEIVDPGSVN